MKNKFEVGDSVRVTARCTHPDFPPTPKNLNTIGEVTGGDSKGIYVKFFNHIFYFYNYEIEKIDTDILPEQAGAFIEYLSKEINMKEEKELSTTEEDKMYLSKVLQEVEQRAEDIRYKLAKLEEALQPVLMSEQALLDIDLHVKTASPLGERLVSLLNALKIVYGKISDLNNRLDLELE